MKLNTKLSLMLFAGAVALCGNAAYADNTVSIEPITISSYEVVNVPVYLTNTDPVAGMNFTITLPDNVEFAGDAVLNEDRASEDNFFQIAGPSKAGVVLVSSWDQKDFTGNEGEILSFPIKAKEGALSTNREETISITKIAMSNANGSQSYSQDSFTVPVTLKDIAGSYEGTISLKAPNLFRAGQPISLDVNMATTTVSGLQFDLQIPEGFTCQTKVNKDSCELLSPKAMVKITNRPDGVVNVLIVDVSTNWAVNAGTGRLLQLIIDTPADYVAENATFTLSNIVVSVAPGVGVNIDGSSVEMVNTTYYYNTLTTTLENAQALLDDAIKEVMESCPKAYDNGFNGEQIQENINAFKAGLDEAYNGDKLDYAFYEQMNEDITSEIINAIPAFEAAAKAEENTLVYNELNGYLTNVENRLTDAKEMLETQYPNMVDEAMENLEGMVNELNHWQGELDAWKEDGTVTAPENQEAINTFITGVTAALDEWEAGVAQAGNAKYNESYAATFEQLQNKLTDALKDVEEPCSNVIDEYTETWEGMQNELDHFVKMLAQWNEEGTISENREELDQFITKLSAGIDDWTSAIMKASNEKYYQDYNTQLDQIAAAVADANADLEKDCTNVVEEFPSTVIDELIASTKEQLTAWYNDQEIYLNRDAINETIIELEKANNDRVAEAYEASNKAYNESYTATLEQLQNKLTDALKDVEEPCSNVIDEYTETWEGMQNELDHFVKMLAQWNEDATIYENRDELNEFITKLSAGIDDWTSAIMKASNEKYYQDYNAQLDQIAAAVADANADLEKDCPNVVEEYPSTTIDEMIASTKEQLTAWYNDQEIYLNRDAINETIIELEKANNDRVSEAYAASNEKYNETYTEYLTQLQNKLTDALKDVEEPCANVIDEYTETWEGMQNELDHYVRELASWYEEGTIYENRDELDKFILDLDKGVDSWTAAVIKAANEKYNATYSEYLTQLQNKLTDAYTDAENDCANVLEEGGYAETWEGMQNELDHYKKMLAEWGSEGTIEENREELDQFILDLDKAVDGWTAAIYEAANQAYYETLSGYLTNLENSYNDTLAKIAEDCPDIDKNLYASDSYMISMIIGMMKTELSKEYEAGKLPETHTQYEEGFAGYEAMINNMWSKCMTAQIDFDYNNVVAAIDAQEAALEAKLAEIKESDPEFNGNEESAKVQDAIDAIRTEAKDAYDKALSELEPYTYEPDFTEIEAMIKALPNSVGISELIVNGVKADAIYNLNGVQIQNPQAGQVVIVLTNGKTQKVLVK